MWINITNIRFNLFVGRWREVSYLGIGKILLLEVTSKQLILLMITMTSRLGPRRLIKMLLLWPNESIRVISWVRHLINLWILFDFMQMNHMDHSGQSPLVHAASNGQLDALSFLLQCDWSGCMDRRPTRNEALQQALIAGASMGHTKVNSLHWNFVLTL